MAEFFQPLDQQDPDRIRKMMLARLFPGQPQPGQPRPPGKTVTPPGQPAVAQPAAAPPDPSAPKPVATPTTGTEPSSQPPPAIAAPHYLSEEDFGKEHPLPEHKPYQAPDLKHRMLMGLFAGMQQFGRNPGAGERMLGNYLGDIEQKTQAEKNYPQTAQEQLHKNYQGYLASQKGPLDLQDLVAQINQRQAEAFAKTHPASKLQHFIIDDPQNPGQPKAVDFDQTTGAYRDSDTGLAIPGAKAWEKPAAAEHAPPALKYDNGIPVAVTGGGKTYDIHDPNLPAELKPLVQSGLAAHRQFLDEQAAREGRAESRAEKARKEKEDQPTAQTKAMAEMVPKVKGLSARIRKQLDEVTTGPTASRLQEIWAGKIGWADPAFTKLRTDAGLLQTALMRMHVGSRGGELMMQHFKDLFDTGKQSPENLRAALDEIDAYADDVAGEGKKGSEKPAAAVDPKNPLGL